MKIKSFVKSAEKLDRRRALGPIILRSYFTLSLSPFLAIQALTRRKTEKERISSRSKNRKWAKIYHLFRSSGEKYPRDNTLAAVNHAFYSRFKQIGLGGRRGIHKFVRYIAAIFAIYSSPVSLSPPSPATTRARLEF